MTAEAAKALTMDDMRRKRQQAAARMLLGVIDAGLPSADDLALIVTNLRFDLTETERALLLAILIPTFPADEAERVVAASFEGAGYPGPALMPEALSDARFWASQANAKEIDAYAMACVERMAPKRREQFKAWIDKRGAK